MDDRKKCISYSLFGYDREQHAGCFTFASYLRGFYLNLRMARLIFTDWEIVLHVDNKTYNAFKELFDNTPGLVVKNLNEAQLCKMMLWRMMPSFEMEAGKWKYSHVICRDLDSPLTYRDAQAVQYWINRDKAMHAITDSISHSLPLLGGMIGMKPDYFNERVAQSWDAMIELYPMDYTYKGTDQDFLNKVIYPRFAQKGNDSITQHYFLGMANTFLSDYRTCGCHSTIGHESYCPNNTEISIPVEMRESNSTCGHIGSSGHYETAMFKFLHKHKDKFTDILEVEKNHPDIFYWAKDKTFE